MTVPLATERAFHVPFAPAVINGGNLNPSHCLSNATAFPTTRVIREHHSSGVSLTTTPHVTS